tara:strand:- start:663 stop:1265 length:603 start_codon:yes stop_codon:yes gene_type:complete
LSTDHQHFALNKPFGYVSQFVSNQRLAHKKKYLGELYNFPEGTMAVGRLDEPSEGLLILTTDGVMSEKIRSKSIEKEYWAQLDGLVGEEALLQMRQGIEINVEGKAHLSQAVFVESMPQPSNLQERSKAIRDERHGPTSWVRIILREGKYRQVRKMTAAAGFPTLRLIRASVGGFQLGNMKAGECIELDQKDLESLLNST